MLTYQGHINGRDTRKSVEWFREAASADLLPSIYMLGVLYMEGEGVFKNYDKAFEQFMRAAKRGDARAQYMVGAIYAEGFIDPEDEPDYAKAFLWSGLAVLGGVKQAQSLKIAASVYLEKEEEARIVERAAQCPQTNFELCD